MKKALISLLLLATPVISYASSSPIIGAGSTETNNPNTVVRPIFLRSIDQGQSWTAITKITNMPADPKWLQTTAIGCSQSNCAAGGYQNPSVLPFMVFSKDGGESWKVTQKIANVPLGLDEQVLDNISCSDNFCVGAGSYFTNNDKHEVEMHGMLLSSTDNGESWTFISNIANLPKSTEFHNVNCQGNSCVATGDYLSGEWDTKALLAVSQNYGQTWSLAQGVAPDNSMALLASSCNGNFCLAAGLSKQFPLIVASTDEGSNWNVVKNITGLPSGVDGYTLQAVMASPKNSIAIGSAWHEATSDEEVFVLGSKDSGQSWQSKKISGDEVGKEILLSFTQINNTYLAVGENFYDVDHPTLLASYDNGETWEVMDKQLGLSSIKGVFNSVSCKDSTCTMLGNEENGDNKYPLIFVSQDAGKTWMRKTSIYGLPKASIDMQTLANANAAMLNKTGKAKRKNIHS